MIKIAVIGATGAVGIQMLKDLEELPEIKPENLLLFASPRSAGKTLEFKGVSKQVQEFNLDRVAAADFTLMSAGSGFSKKCAKDIVSKGVTVIDNSSAWRMDDDVSLVVPSVNPQEVMKGKEPRIIANPNCSTIQLVEALKPLEEKYGLKHVNVATYQSVSGSGQKGVAALDHQVRAFYGLDSEGPDYGEIAFNTIPAIDVMSDDNWCFEEIKMVQETQKILSRPDLTVVASTVRVPVFYCHGEMVSVELKSSTSKEEALKLFQSQENILVHESAYDALPVPTSVRGSDKTHVSRIRTLYGQKTSAWLQMWVIADNLRKGAATNAVQILKKLII